MGLTPALIGGELLAYICGGIQSPSDNPLRIAGTHIGRMSCKAQRASRSKNAKNVLKFYVGEIM